MLAKHKALREEREDGFTLIELLVVILIIGILSTIALPVFLNQRKTANDSAVQSDVKNATSQVETWLVANNNTADFPDATDRVGPTWLLSRYHPVSQLSLLRMQTTVDL